MKEIHSTVQIFPGSHIIGNVIIGKNSSIWYNAVLRGDIETIVIKKCSNIQDNCVVHSSKNYPIKLGNYVSVGHAAVLHGCELENNVLVGMNATVLNGARIGENSIVGAGALVTENKKFPPGSLVMGLPAKVVRSLNSEEQQSIKDNALRYVNLSKKYSMK